MAEYHNQLITGIKDVIREDVLEHIKWNDFDIDNEANDIYYSEFNYNNADPTSRMNCWERCEIEEAIKNIYDEYKDNYND